MRLPPRKKKIFTPVFPTDPVGAEFCRWFWQLNRGWDWIVGNCPTPKEKTRWTTEHFPLQPDELWQRHQDPEEAIGVCFKKFTRYGMLDIDRGSAIHPDNDPTKYAQLLAALRTIGLISPVVVRSSWSEGLHIYYPLPKAVSSFGLACAIKWTLFDHGILLGDGQLETFPNTKSFGSDGNFVQFKCHRLPLQPGSGSYLLDATLEPYSDEVADLLDEFNTAAQKQNLELLKQVLAVSWKRQALSRGFGGSGRTEKWQRHLERRLSTGWTAFSQTNGLIKDIATYGRVFVRLEGRALIDYTVQTATSAPGYEQFCRHQHEIRRRVEDWSRCVEALYWPYGSEPSREGTYAEHFHREPASDCPPASNNIVSFNATRSAQALERIRQAVAHLEESGNLPDTATARSYAIIAASKQLTGTGISQTTLHKPKYLLLWHPDHYFPPAETCVIDCPEPVAAVLSEQKYPIEPDPWLEPESPKPAQIQAFPQNYTYQPYMKGFGLPCLPKASAAPQAQADALDSSESSNLLKSSSAKTHKEIKCQEKSGAVDFDDNSALSVEISGIEENFHRPTLASAAPTVAPAVPTLAPDVPTELTPEDFRQVARLRVQAIAHSQKVVKQQRLATGRFIKGPELKHLEKVAQMQFYWQSGSELLRAEARAWARANPGCIPEIDQLNLDQAELSPPAPLVPPAEPTTTGAQSQTIPNRVELSHVGPVAESNAKSTDCGISPSSAATAAKGDLEVKEPTSIPDTTLPSTPTAAAEATDDCTQFESPAGENAFAKTPSPTGDSPVIAKKVWRFARPLFPGARVKVGNHYGTLATKTPNGKWLIDWDTLPASQRKQYGSPPTGAFAPEQIQLIEPNYA